MTSRDDQVELSFRSTYNPSRQDSVRLNVDKRYLLCHSIDLCIACIQNFSFIIQQTQWCFLSVICLLWIEIHYTKFPITFPKNSVTAVVGSVNSRFVMLKGKITIVVLNLLACELLIYFPHLNEMAWSLISVCWFLCLPIPAKNITMHLCFNELIFNTSLRSVPVYMKCISRDACVTKLDVFIWVNQWKKYWFDVVFFGYWLWLWPCRLDFITIIMPMKFTFEKRRNTIFAWLKNCLRVCKLGCQ